MDKEKKKEFPITVWLTAEQMERLERYCIIFGLPKSTVCRNAIRKYTEID